MAITAQEEAQANGDQRTPMSDEHKAALAEGRVHGRAVQKYLEALEAHRPRRGRKRTREGMEKRLASIETIIATSDPLARLHLTQERMDLTAALATEDEVVDLEVLEKGFVEAAGPYSERKGISFGAWRELGVRAEVLLKAGIPK